MRAPQNGFTLIELMISLAVLGVLISLGAPGFVEWLQNQQIRGVAEATLNGLQVARGEAVRSNTPVRFQLVSDLTSACVLASDSVTAPVSVSWVVSLRDPTNKCDTKADPADPANPQIVQSRTSAEGSPNARATSVFVPSPPGPPAQAASTVTFAALGNVVANADATPSINKIDVTNINVTGATRPLRIIVNPGGSMRMCDPALALPEPRGCPAFP
ncbi:MAG: prepilin-type N-terminal cleavage/methylation domain-containing protein [Betaproteobacteria bacterium]|nr:MAG: prepilin-type N-terminal cleavage/methylation domain-containing protein [Betaproteobacteria bacterium]